MTTNKRYANSSYLIYNCYEKRDLDASIITGSILLDCAYTEEDAAALVNMYKSRSEEFYPGLCINTTNRFLYRQV